MKIQMLIFLIFSPIFLIAQVNESFTDGDFTNNPEWSGLASNFIVNGSMQLQSNAASASTSYLFTASEAFNKAVWECKVKITYTTSSSNYASIYIVSDNTDILNGCNAYYVQVGGTNDEVSLFVQQGTKKTKIIDGSDKRTDGNPIELQVKVTRDADGNFELFSKLSTETVYFSEGKTQNTLITNCSYFGLLFANTSTTGSAYYFDDIIVTGEKADDKEAPEWENVSFQGNDKLRLTFSEKMNFNNAHFEVDNGMGEPLEVEIQADQKSVILGFSKSFEKGIIYTVRVTGLADMSGNELLTNSKIIGIPEAIEPGDLVWNEVMFENPANSVEYVEIYNKSDKVFHLGATIFTTRKTDGTLSTENKIPENTLIAPASYLALCADVDSLKNYHNVPAESNIVKTSWSALNNEKATIVLCNNAKDTIYDELTYNVKWHHVLVKNPKGVALERINPGLPTQDAASWHSAASEVNYGTPGYKNSQYRELNPNENPERFVWTEPEAFSPDNDGVDDICFIRYALNSNGYVANVLILNAVGVKVCELASNSLLQAEGFLTWDGKTDKGKNANVGIYIIYFEIFNPQTGAKKAKKLPIVVSSR
ncbi:MAG: lamin tail domain-containing protein [Paludibacter sp.]